MLWIAIAVGAALVFLVFAQRGSSSGEAHDLPPPMSAHTLTLSGAPARDGSITTGPPQPPAKPDRPAGMYTFGFIWRWENGTWHLDTPADCEPITRIHGAGGALWATGWKEIWQHTPTGWIRHDMPVRLFAMHGWPTGEFMAGGVYALYRLEGDRFVDELRLPDSLRAIWGPSPDDVYAVGWNGMIMRKQGEEWSRESSGTTQRLNGIWGQSGTVIIVGERGVALRSNGNGQWVQESLPAGSDDRTLCLAGVWGDGAGVWYAVADGGEILARRDGEWTIEHTVKWQLLGIQGCAKRGEVWASGLQGQLWHSAGDGEWIDRSGARSNSLNTVHRDGERLWVGGDWFFEIAELRPGVGPG